MTEQDGNEGVEPGHVFIASCEGISVWDRDGNRKFARFFVPEVPSAGAKASVVDWSDMIYDGCRLASGNYLCASHEWIREIAPDGAIVWEYRVAKPVELKTCVPLPNGDVMTVDADRMELIQLTDQGRQIARRIPVPTDPKSDIHVRYNLLRRTPAGTFLLALRAEKAYIEIDDQGRELWRYIVPGMPAVAERLPTGNTLMSWRGDGAGSSGGLIEVDPAGQVVWKLDVGDVEGFHGWFGGFHRFENGNTLVSNSDWHYHDPKETALQLVEVTRDKRVAWKLGVEQFAGKKPGSLEPSTGLVEQRIIGIQWLGSAPIAANPIQPTSLTHHAEQFRGVVAPLLTKACSSCHDAEAREGGVVLTTVDGTLDQPAEVALWKKVRRVLADNKMPPQEADPVTAQEVALLCDWIDRGLELERERLMAKGGRHVVRRLTNREFNRSLLTLVGAESSLRDFVSEQNAPVDAVESNGFSNDAGSNPLTKSHLEAFKQAALEALADFAPYIEQPRPPLHYFYHGEYCYTSRATQDHVFDFVKNVAHPLSDHEFRSRREIEKIAGNSFLGRPMNKAVFGPALFSFQPGPLEKFDHDLLLANAVAFPASEMYSRGTFQFRIRVRGKPAADGTLPMMRIQVGYFDVFANHFRALDSVQLTEQEQVLEFFGNLKDFPFLDGIPPERTFRDGNVPSLASFSTNDWYDTMAGLLIVQVENATRHEHGLPKTPGHHRYSLGNIHIGSYDEIYERARAKTLPNYYMQDSELVEVFRKNQAELAGKAPAIEIDWAELTLNDAIKHNAVFFEAADRGPTDSYAEQVIRRFYHRAARGYATPGDLQPFLELYRSLRAEGEGFERAVHEVLATILVAPEHLFLGNFGPPDDPRGEALLLAGKLSFWLWGEPPDSRLLAACENGQLLKDTTLIAEVERMFADPRIERFIDHFLIEAWHLDRFDTINVNERQHPLYDADLEADIKEQFRRTVHDALGLHGRASVLSLIHDDHLWVNRRLATASRVDGYSGRGEFVKVKLPPDSPLGGVLTQARILKMNSDGTDSHPVRRGTWILERILFDPPPPPPKVTPLNEQGLIKAASLRERIAAHAASGDSCMGCHRRIDPFGLAFENFDATGTWRDAVMLGEQPQKIDIAFELEGGRKIASLRDLKAYILESKADAFSRGFVESLVRYAVARQLDPLDDVTVDAAHLAFAESGYEFATLVKMVATSLSFQGSLAKDPSQNSVHRNQGQATGANP